MRIKPTVVFLLLGTASITPAYAITYTVNSTLDEVDTEPGDRVCLTNSGTCTLRAAVMEANASRGPDTVSLPSGTYPLTISATGDESLDRIGDLDITQPLAIIGNAANRPVIQALSTGSRVIDDHTSVTGSVVHLQDLEITGGSTSSAGGGLYGRQVLRLTNVKVWGNRSSNCGGGISSAGALIMVGSEVSDNEARCGGGISMSGETTIATSSIFGNRAVVDDPESITLAEGGGLSISGDTVTITNSAIFDNRVETTLGQAYGGGISYSTTNTLTVTNSTLSGNEVKSSGGGSTFGGGIALMYGNAVVEISSSTLVQNSAESTGESSSGGGLYNDDSGATITLRNSILAENTAATGPDCAGAVESGNYNLLGNIVGCAFSDYGNDQTGDSSAGEVLDPGLEPLADNGGKTKTHALLPDSPARDSGDAGGCVNASGNILKYDQRGPGYKRSVSICDIGAYERQLP